MDGLIRRHLDSVDALCAHAEATAPSPYLPKGPLTSACRKAVRAVLAIFNKASENYDTRELVMVQHDFIKKKLLPPKSWVSTYCGRRHTWTAVFRGVLPRLLEVVVEAEFVAGTYVLMARAHSDGNCLWSAAIKPRFPAATPCPPCIAPVVWLCVRQTPWALLFSGTAVDRFRQALRAADGPSQTWEAVKYGVARGLCGATVLRYRKYGHFEVFAGFQYAQHGPNQRVQQKLWVLVAVGGKPDVLLRYLHTYGLYEGTSSFLAVGLLSDGNWLRPKWCFLDGEYNTTTEMLDWWLRWSGGALAEPSSAEQVMLAWVTPWTPSRGVLQAPAAERNAQWTPTRAAWAHAQM
jgi:hypothetical protein